MKLLTVVAAVLIVLYLLARAGAYSAAPSQAQNYTQPPTPLRAAPATRVIDGDTIVIGSTHYRLWGIDAPELGQVCADKWPAGDKARGFLRLLIEGGTVSCDNRGTDKYGRTLAVCRAAETDLNQAMVRTGNAVAYTRYARDYLPDEIAARQARAGMWGHICQNPEDYRHRK